MSDSTAITPEEWRCAESIFHDALEVAPDQRAAFVEAACEGDTALHAAVAGLLTGHDDARGEFLEPVVDLAHATASAGDRPPEMPRQIGKYRLKRIIGSGGMGTVYEAMQEQPRRTVAVKVMKRGLASKSALRRFEYESQILARLHHPCIAQIYEAGVHDDGSGGVQYFAMEYIPNARSLTSYARERKLGVREKLPLFEDVCRAVHHGHQKGIIHRDLKPDNILVDANGQPKVIDFGVARATDSDMAVTTLQTDIGQLVGSVQYMSPEQVEADPHDLDIRSDVYTLGIVLYELLTDRLPYDASRVSIFEATRVIREGQPRRLSTKDSSLRGDLETIVAHTIDKDRERRYQSADELRRDIRRFLDDEPISARPPSLTYHLRVFARRNRVAVSAALAVLVMMVAATIVSIGFAVSATRAARAEKVALERSESVTKFLGTILSSARPEYARGREVTVRQVLDEAAERAETELAGQPFIEAAARVEIGRSYHSLGDHAEAERHLRRAVELEREIHERGASSDQTRLVRAMMSLGWAVLDQNRIAEARRLYEEALVMSRDRYGDDHPMTAEAMSGVASCLLELGRFAESETMLLRALEIARTAYGEDHDATISMYNTWALAVNDRGRHAEAESHFREILELRLGAAGRDHPSSALGYNNLAWSLGNQGKYAEAERYYRDGLEINRRIHGDDHPQTGLVLGNLAGCVVNQGRFDEGEAYYRESLDTLRDALGDAHGWTGGAALGLSWVLGLRGRHDEALEHSRDALEINRRAFGEDHRLVARAYQGLARDLTALDRVEEAEPYLRRSLEIVLDSSDEELDSMARAYNELAFNLSEQGRHADAEPLFDHALAIRMRVRGADHPYTLLLLHNTGRVRLEQGKIEEAESRLRQVVDASEDALPEGHWHRAVYSMTYGRCLRMQERFDEAEPYLLQSHEDLVAAFGPEHERARQAADELVTLYEQWDRPDAAEDWRERASETEDADS